MKIPSSFFVISLLATLGMLACNRKMQSQNTGGCTAVPAGDTAVFFNNQIVALFECDKRINATVIKITDSRCPKGVQCITAGTATAVIHLSDHSELILDIGRSREIHYQNQDYIFTLTDVLPYPVANAPAIEMQKAIIKIIRK